MATSLAAALAAAGSAGWADGEVEWPSYAGNASSQRFSDADQITPSNVVALTPAWQWSPRDGEREDHRQAAPGRFESTPLMLDGVLYVTSPLGGLAAIDAETGRQRWWFDPKGTEEGPTSVGVGFVHRGVAAWYDGERLRLFLGSRYRLFSIDAATGRPVETFGDSGLVDLSKHTRRAFDKHHVELTSPPTVFEDLVIVGNAVGDRLIYPGDPPGEVRAFDARTGALVWSFGLIPRPGEFGVETWERDSWSMAGHTNVWTTMTVDVERGLLFVPVSTPSNDYYGGRRRGSNLFAESLVCLDARTGQRRWHFQTVHHGIWDYDLPAGPTLATVRHRGRNVDVVVQVTKTGFAFVFERETGTPLWPIEERPVAQSDVPGEQAFATQPVPTQPPPFTPQGVALDDAFDLTPELKRAAQETMRRFRLGAMFTPPSLQGTLTRPSNIGGANWGGAALDPASGTLFVHATNGVSNNRLARFDRATSTSADAAFTDADWVISAYTKEGASPNSFMGGLPLIKPPFATVTAIDLNAGSIVWQVPFGEGPGAIRRHPALKGVALPARLGTPSNAGVIATAGGLVFGGAGDPALYALDVRTGQELWRGTLPEPASGTPMTYRTASGRQFVVIAAGGGARSVLAAFSLAETARR